MLKIQKEELPEMGVIKPITGLQLLARMKAPMFAMQFFLLPIAQKLTSLSTPMVNIGLLHGVTQPTCPKTILCLYVRIKL
jgi:hypothetical protein